MEDKLIDDPNYFFRETAFLEIFLAFDVTAPKDTEDDEPEGLDWYREINLHLSWINRMRKSVAYVQHFLLNNAFCVQHFFFDCPIHSNYSKQVRCNFDNKKKVKFWSPASNFIAKSEVPLRIFTRKFCQKHYLLYVCKNNYERICYRESLI